MVDMTHNRTKRRSHSALRSVAVTAVALVALAATAVPAELTGPAQAAVRNTTRAGGSQLWVARQFDAMNFGSGKPVATSPDGSKVFVTGGSSVGFTTTAYDAKSGTTLWKTIYSGPTGAGGEAVSVAVSPDGSKVFVTGSSVYTGADGSVSVATVAYDASTGTQLWATPYMVPGSTQDTTHALAVSPDGSMVFAAGELKTPQIPRPQFFLIAYDASTGTQAWVRSYTGMKFDDYAGDIAVSPNSSEVFLIGTEGNVAAPGNNSSEWATIAYQARTGARLWLQHYVGPANTNNVPLALAVSPDGSKLFVAGATTRPGTTTSDYDAITIAYNATSGAQMWLRRYNGTGNMSDRVDSIAVSPDGSRVFVAGNTGPTHSGARTDLLTIAYAAASGAQQWTRRYVGAAGQSEGATRLAMSHDGSTLVIATTAAGGNSVSFDYMTMAYDTTGRLLWTARYNNGPRSPDTVIGLALTPDNSEAIVTGWCGAGTTKSPYNMATVAYSLA